jgi:hypothetical protein
VVFWLGYGYNLRLGVGIGYWVLGKRYNFKNFGDSLPELLVYDTFF